MSSNVLRDARRIVVKVGSSLVTNEGRGLDEAAIEEWSRQLAALVNGEDGVKREVIMVSSGAIAEGMKRLGWATRPTEVHELQAAAAVGQMGLAQMYETKLRGEGVPSAQVLLTHADLADRERYLNARTTLLTLLQLGVVPVINENDTVVIDEIRFGDNDTLGALVANLVEADALIILTDQQGLYTADPRKDPAATLIGEGRAEDRQYEAMAGGSGSAISKGGMITKIRAAQRAARSGAHTCIASGREPDPILRLAAGEALGTLLYASSTPLQARKQWLADHLQLAGDLVIDDGAVAALKSGKSLLPVGVVEVRGDFERGAVVACRNIAGEEVARGLVNYSASECRRIARRPTSEIGSLLGYVDEPEIIHRDNMVIR